MIDPRLSALTRHFFHSFFRLSFLDDAGEESFKRGLIGVLAVIIAFGLLLGRIYMAKYAMLSSLRTPAPFQLMLPADQLLMLSLPMFFVAFVMALVSHSVFPDETDYWILMGLPVPRWIVFAAKVAALFLFTTVFIAAANVGIGVPFTFVTSGRWSGHSFVVRLAIQLVSGTLASTFTVACIIAIEGLIVVLTPRPWLPRVSVVMQTMLIAGLVLSLPIINRMPAFGEYISTKPRAMFLAPPMWFVGLQQWLLGSDDPFFSRLALSALAGTLAFAALGAGCYLIVYRRFDKVILRTAGGRPPWSVNVRIPWPFRRHPAHDAVQGFTSATLRRSGLHQLVFFGLLTIGVALAATSAFGNAGDRERSFIAALLQVPLTLIAAAVIGLRAALLLPTNLRASWIFGITEDQATRRHQLEAVRHLFVGLGVMLPVALAAPVYVGMLGARTALTCLPVVVLLGWIFVEIAIGRWRRIPFTCTVLFGKRPPAYTVLLAFLAFGVFGTVGTLFIIIARSGWRSWLVIMAILVTIIAVLRWQRLQTWGRLGLEFEDYLPDRIETLGL